MTRLLLSVAGAVVIAAPCANNDERADATEARNARDLSGSTTPTTLLGMIMKRLLLTGVACLLALPSEPLPLAAAPRKHCDDTRSLYRCDDFATNRDDLRDAKESQRAQSTPVRGVQSQQAQSTLVRGVSGGVPGYAFNVITIRHGIHGHEGGNGASGNSGGSIAGGNSGRGGEAPPFSINQIRSEPFGVFATLQECDAARAVKIAELDARGDRFMHQRTDAPTITTHFSDGSSVTGQQALQERNDVTVCEPGSYSPGASPNGIASNPQIMKAAFTPATEVTELNVPPGFVKHWVSPRPFTRVIPGTSEVVEVLSASGQELVFMVKPDIDLPPTTNILLVDDNGEVIANLKIVIPGKLNRELRQGPDGTRVYRKDNPNYVPPKEKK